MRSNLALVCSATLVGSALGAAIVRPRDGGNGNGHGNGNGNGKGNGKGSKYEHVAVFSVDGMHNSDLDKYITLKPASTFATLLKTGYRYSQCFAAGPSDSFPGTLATYTGASPRTHGVWYDDVWDRDLFDIGSSCTGSSGAEIIMDESLDFDDTKVFSGGINPANLPKAKIDGKCVPVYPHMRPRVNTAFEVVANEGGKTAYTDKHPAYDLVRGPSGKGLSLGYFPEITGFGGTVANVIDYDTLHVNAFLDWIDGKDPANSEGSLGGKTPTLFGGNFQAVSVGQKTKGYVAGSLTFTPDLLMALDFIDASLAKVVNKLKSKGLYEKTLIVLSPKHGQSPIDPTKFTEVAPALFEAALAVPHHHTTFDSIAMVYLADQKDLATAVKNLQANKTALKIDDIIYGQRQIDLGYGNPLKDGRVPDIIIQPTAGVIYSTSSKKIAEHGGLSEDDRHVACFASAPGLAKQTFGQRVETKQFAPVILGALGIKADKLQGVSAEGTTSMPGFAFKH